MHPALIPTLAVLPILTADRSDDPRFAVEAKSSLTKTFESTSRLASKSFKLSLDGDEDLLSGMGEVQFSLESTERVEVTDEYLSTGEGHPTRLRRTFEKLHGTGRQRSQGPGGEEEESEDAAPVREEESRLEGQSVLFTWNEETSSFDASFEGEEGEEAPDEDLLEGLAEDMDFRGMLPADSVSEGEGWDLEAEVFQAVLWPGGDLKLKSSEQEGSEEGSAEEIDRKLRENLEGRAHATWKGVREEDGRKLGVIAVVADLSSEGEVEPGGDRKGTTWFRNEIEIEGELLWDLVGGHFRSFDAEGKSEFSIETKEDLDIDGKSMELLQSVEFEGEFSFRAAAR